MPHDNMLRFAYVHAPDGSPDLEFRFAGVAPTMPLPVHIYIRLHRQDEPARFDAVLFTDPQPESLHEVGYVRDDVVSVVDGSQAAFAITHGDIMFDDLSYYPRFNRIIGTIGLPWFNCFGNHDMNLEAPDNTHAAETFKRVFGARWGLAFDAGLGFLKQRSQRGAGAAEEKPSPREPVSTAGTRPAEPLDRPFRAAKSLFSRFAATGGAGIPDRARCGRPFESSWSERTPVDKI
jgi:hypothetical protein